MKSLPKLTKLVAEVCNVPASSITSNNRKREVADARTLLIHFAPELSLKELAYYLQVNHSSVIYHRHKYADLVRYDEAFRAKSHLLGQRIREHENKIITLSELFSQHFDGATSVPYTHPNIGAFLSDLSQENIKENGSLIIKINQYEKGI